MDNFKYDFTEEYERVIDEISQKFNYKDELKEILKRITKVSIQKKSYEERQVFYEVLRSTPIIVIPRDSDISEKELIEEMIGDVNPHIVDKNNIDEGEYDKTIASGAFVMSPVIDRNLNIVGTKKFIYVKEFDTTKEMTENDKMYFDKFNTGINVPHLIHEIGHAWASQLNPYTIKNGILTQRVGTSENKFKISDLGNGKFESEKISSTGIFIEEGINTNFEEQTVADYLDISLEDAKKLYKNGILIPSSYQPGISNMISILLDTPLKKHLEKWRMFGSEKSLEYLNDLFSRTNFYEKRDRLFFRNELVQENPENNLIIARNICFNNPKLEENEKELLKRIEKDFFPETEEMTPMQMLDNILMQQYDVSVNKYHIKIDNYNQFLNIIGREGYGIIKQAFDIYEQQASKENEVK